MKTITQSLPCFIQRKTLTYGRKATGFKPLWQALCCLLLIPLLSACIAPIQAPKPVAPKHASPGATDSASVNDYRLPCPHYNGSICFKIYGPRQFELGPRPTDMFGQKASAYLAVFDSNIGIWESATLLLDWENKYYTEEEYLIMSQSMFTCYKFEITEGDEIRLAGPVVGGIYLQANTPSFLGGFLSYSEEDNAWQFSKDSPDDVIVVKLQKGEVKKTVRIDNEEGALKDYEFLTVTVTPNTPEQAVEIPYPVVGGKIKVFVNVETKGGKRVSYQTAQPVNINEGTRANYFKLDVQNADVTLKPITCHEDGSWE